jgi:hypothetical protein
MNFPIQLYPLADAIIGAPFYHSGEHIHTLMIGWSNSVRFFVNKSVAD